MQNHQHNPPPPLLSPATRRSPPPPLRTPAAPALPAQIEGRGGLRRRRLSLLAELPRAGTPERCRDRRRCARCFPPHLHAVAAAPATQNWRRRHLREACLRAHPKGGRTRPSTCWFVAGVVDAAAVAPATDDATMTSCWGWAADGLLLGRAFLFFFFPFFPLLFILIFHFSQN